MELVVISLMLLVGAQAQHGGLISSLGFGEPCKPSTCGPNTICSVSKDGISQCRCLGGFVPDGHTINGCTPGCRRDNDCFNGNRFNNFRCQASKCVIDGRTPPNDICQPNPCGQNAECRPRDNRPVCTCPIGYKGDPLTNCTRGECVEANECPGNMTCQKLNCINPCNIPNICGRDAECQTIDHQPSCSCRVGMRGDPLVSCEKVDPCRISPHYSSPCGRNTKCAVRNDRAVCTCMENYLGDPLTGCYPECVSYSDCQSGMACENNKCVNPCTNACGEGADCDVIQGRARCSCPESHRGNPQFRCYPECTAHTDCSNYQACYKYQCVDPCDGVCGVDAECKVENHKPICFCPNGYTGNPLQSCRPISPADLCRPNPCGQGAVCTPGHDRHGNLRPVCTCPGGFIGNPTISCKRGDCERHDHCRDQQSCYDNICQNACYIGHGSVCGDNAKCTVTNHLPVCTCPPGYDGNAINACYQTSGATAGHSSPPE